MEIYQIKNFINKDDIEKIINYIDKNIGTTSNDSKKSRTVLKFGLQKNYEHVLPVKDFNMLGEIKDLINYYWNKTAKTIEELTGAHEKVYPSAVWLSKQYPGNFIEPHKDSNKLTDYMYSYIAVLYLNKQAKGGNLHFPDLEIFITPETGELVFFDGLELHAVTTVRQERYTVTMRFASNIEYKYDENTHTA